MELTSDQKYRLKNRDLINERARERHAEQRDEINTKRRIRWDERKLIDGLVGKAHQCPKCDKFFSKSYLATHLEYCGSDAKPEPVEKVACPICDKLVCKTYLQKHVLRKHPL